MKKLSPKEAVEIISSGHRVFIQGGTATPQALVNAIAERYQDFDHRENLYRAAFERFGRKGSL